jgi:uncharacterized protein (DUF1800 family)
MPVSLSSMPPEVAWQPLPESEWNESAARHLLLRIGWSATPEETKRALDDGPRATLRRYFQNIPAFEKPAKIAELEEDAPGLQRRMGGRAGSEPERRKARQEARERSREALADMTIKWLQLAARPENAPAEKWLLFLQDIWVVGIEKVRNSALIYQHQDWIRRSALSRYPMLAKAMSRSPAMIVYLDLQQSREGAPNENYARELFELFTLGEGNYTERDIKEAARAYTGHRQVAGRFQFAARQHDGGTKTIFGKTGAFDGDDVVDLVFHQPAARTFLPREMARYYLSDAPLPPAHLAALGNWWAAQEFSLPKLLGAFFCSRLFYAPEFRGNLIKSPIQYYLGLMQDLNLTPAPVPRAVIGALRLMGQMPFNPPNVRGWVGGRNWINSATLAARRQVVNGLLSPLPMNALNADDRASIEAAAAQGVTNFTLTPERFDELSRKAAPDAARELVGRTLPHRVESPLEKRIADFLETAEGAPRQRARTALATLLESPDYQLC